MIEIGDFDRLSDLPVPGWAKPRDSRAAHYFYAAESLCGTWLYYGPRGNYPDSVDHCLLCHRKLSVANEKVRV